MSREPIRRLYDAVLDIHPHGAPPSFAYGLVKRTYRIEDGECVLDEAEPLTHDIRDPEADPRFAPGSDFWPFKARTDVVARGAAYGRGGKPTATCTVRLGVGDTSKRIKVFGRRVVRWRGSKPVLGHPEPFESMPMHWGNAYGGWDGRVPIEEPSTVTTLARLELDHPGVYPRNPFGKGYLVVPEPVDGLEIELPNLEDPEQLLRSATLLVRDPSLWYRQPLPVCFEYTNAMMFQRFTWLGAEAWYPPPPEALLAEVEEGWLPANWHELQAIDLREDPAPLPFFQEAAPGLSFDPLEPGTPISVTGMSPEQHRLDFVLPAAPKVELEIDGDRQELPPQLTNVLVHPADAEVSLTWIVRREEFPRVFIVGIHSEIPMNLYVDGDDPIIYETPVPPRDQLKQARDSGAPMGPEPPPED